MQQMHSIGRSYTYWCSKVTQAYNKANEAVLLFFLSEGWNSDEILHIYLWGSYGNPLTCCFLFINPPAVHSNEPKGNISLMIHHSFNSQPLLCVFCPDFLILTFSGCSSKSSSAMKERVWYPLHFVWVPLSTSDCYAVHICAYPKSDYMHISWL